ncbi:hypothetical protein B0H99_102170 [Planomicrobium soli]|uniref:Uncharacterized protein n=1 Tax=Planomicrobium soli TaxID=1176648 RepID=A0A2P8H5I2_9BACL|nr:hypothetical protein [Planomicrobium soli]PSL41486.1 hypothetical protein B0H99_102170 [Planomicrobium soli]
MEYQLTIRLTSEKKGYFWLFESEEDTISIFNEVVKTFEQYEPNDVDLFMREKRKEIEETGETHAVQIDVTKNEKHVVVRSAAYNEMWYEGKHFNDIFNTLTERLGRAQELEFDSTAT